MNLNHIPPYIALPPEFAMKPVQETMLAAIPAQDGRSRVVVMLRCGEGGSLLEMRQQSWAEGIGWFTQSSVQIEPGQLAELRSAIGGASARPRTTVPFASPAAAPPPRAPGFMPRVVRADSA